jgi:hypothetical protein
MRIAISSQLLRRGTQAKGTMLPNVIRYISSLCTGHSASSAALSWPSKTSRLDGIQNAGRGRDCSCCAGRDSHKMLGSGAAIRAWSTSSRADDKRTRKGSRFTVCGLTVYRFLRDGRGQRQHYTSWGIERENAAKGGYPLSPTCCSPGVRPTHHIAVGCRPTGRRLLHQAKEELAPMLRCSPVETEREFVQVVVQMLRP